MLYTNFILQRTYVIILTIIFFYHLPNEAVLCMIIDSVLINS